MNTDVTSHWRMPDFSSCIWANCMQGLAFLPHLVGVASLEHHVPPRSGTAHLRCGEQWENRGAMGRHWAGGPPVLGWGGAWWLLLWRRDLQLCWALHPLSDAVCFTKLLTGLISSELRMDCSNFGMTRLLFLCLPMAFSDMCVFLQSTALLSHCSGCIPSLHTLNPWVVPSGMLSSFATTMPF